MQLGELLGFYRQRRQLHRARRRRMSSARWARWSSASTCFLAVSVVADMNTSSMKDIWAGAGKSPRVLFPSKMGFDSGATRPSTWWPRCAQSSAIARADPRRNDDDERSGVRGTRARNGWEGIRKRQDDCGVRRHGRSARELYSKARALGNQLRCRPATTNRRAQPIHVDARDACPHQPRGALKFETAFRVPGNVRPSADAGSGAASPQRGGPPCRASGRAGGHDASRELRRRGASRRRTWRTAVRPSASSMRGDGDRARRLGVFEIDEAPAAGTVERAAASIEPGPISWSGARRSRRRWSTSAPRRSWCAWAAASRTSRT